MKIRYALVFGAALTVAASYQSGVREPLAERIVHNDPSKYHHSPAGHNGPGALNYMALFDFHTLDTNLFFLRRGVIEPKSGRRAHSQQLRRDFRHIRRRSAVHD